MFDHANKLHMYCICDVTCTGQTSHPFASAGLPLDRRLHSKGAAKTWEAPEELEAGAGIAMDAG